MESTQDVACVYVCVSVGVSMNRRTLSHLPSVLLKRVQTAEQKKEEFRGYLDKSGVVDTLTKGA